MSELFPTEERAVQRARHAVRAWMQSPSLENAEDAYIALAIWAREYRMNEAAQKRAEQEQGQ